MALTPVLSETSHSVHQRKDGESALLLSEFKGSFRKPLRKALAIEHLGDCFSILAEPSYHRSLKDRGKLVASRVLLLDASLDDSTNLREPVADVCGVLPLELNDFYCIPNDVILADLLKPKCLDS